MRRFLAAVVQLDSKGDKEANLENACRFIDEAASRGAKLVALPEAMNLIGENLSEGDGQENIPGYTSTILSSKAKEHGVFLHCGSIRERNPDGGRFHNTTVMMDDSGRIIATYRKLHAFDATLADGTICKESNNVHPGSDIVSVDTPLGCLGFSICYDIRFPELFRLLALEGAQIIFAPANFTLPTGKDHWEALLRARAIENGCYIVAPAQIGRKPKFMAYGNSMIIDPWGTVIARARDEPGIAMGEIDLDYLSRIRVQLPSLENRREDVYELSRISRDSGII